MPDTALQLLQFEAVFMHERHIVSHKVQTELRVFSYKFERHLVTQTPPVAGSVGVVSLRKYCVLEIVPHFVQFVGVPVHSTQGAVQGRHWRPFVLGIWPSGHVEMH